MLTMIFLTWLRLFHPFYVSMTEVQHNEKAKRLEVSCKVFSNDLEAMLEKKYQTSIDILQARDKARIEPLLQDYLKQHLRVQVDGKPVAFRFLGYEIEEDATWCFLEAVKVNQVKRLEIKNDILFAEHPTQTNMLHVTVKGRRQSTKLDNPQSQASFRF
ncbi:MAG: DUF6702 family protein [Adhaeribacter sp.]